MINNKISDLILHILGPNDLVIDIGGARYPWFRANYILDKRQYDEKVGEVAFGGENYKKEFFTKKTWISRDFYNLPWPFKDNFFDFSLCMGTLEDLRDPLVICKEIQRISKMGYISTPTRAAESKIGVSKHPKSNKLHGYFHHRWFVEIIDSKLVFKMKHPLLYQNKSLLINKIGQHTLNYFWVNNFKFEEKYLSGHDEALEDTKEFLKKHKKWVDNSKTDHFDQVSQYNHWPKRLGTRPKFLEMDNYNSQSKVHQILKKILKN